MNVPQFYITSPLPVLCLCV